MFKIMLGVFLLISVQPSFAISWGEKAKDLVGASPPVQVENVETLVNRFFKNTTCFQENTNQKLQKLLKDKGINAVPSEVGLAVSPINSFVPVFTTEFQGLQKMTHMYGYFSDRSTVDYLDNSDGYANSFINPLSLIDTRENYLIYTLDCSGYITAVANASAGLSSAIAKTAFEGSTNLQKSMVIVTGKIIPILNIAIDPQSTIAIGLPNELTLDILNATLHKLMSDNKLNIEVPKNIQVLSYEKGASTKIQGDVKIQASANANFGFADGGFRGETQASIAQSLKFSNFTTSVISVGSIKVYSIDQIQKQFTKVIGSTSITLESNANPLKLESKITRTLCENGEWKADIKPENDNPLKENIAVFSKFDRGVCEMEVSFPVASRDTSKKYHLNIFPTDTKYLEWKNGRPSFPPIEITN